MQFTKPPLSFDAQLDRLIERGLAVANRERALHYLKHVNYYRLAAYWLPFEADHGTHEIQDGTRFEDVLNLYVFDREFRLLVLDAIERIEVSVRTNWAYQMAHRHGPHCHLDRALFRRHWDYEGYRAVLEAEVRRSRETFIEHLRQTYDEPMPPIWALVEIMTFGQLSLWYARTARRSDRNAVALSYGLDERVLTSLLHHLTTVRNHCAHHSRLWNREFTIQPKLPNSGPARLLNSLRRDDDRRIYNTLTLILYLMDLLSPGHTWRQRLLELLKKHGANTSAMGFPMDWQQRPLWIVIP
jgi:abortive infection bacteriophage resistance protein